jgi:hypothetical protein
MIFNHIPPTGDGMNDFAFITRGMGVFSLTLIWYLDSRETSPTFVCIRPKRIPEIVNLIQMHIGQASTTSQVLIT